MEELYPKMKKDLLDEMDDMRKHYGSVFGDKQFEKIFGSTIDDFILNETQKAIGALKLRVFGDNNQYHVWVGINPPPGEFTMLQLYEKVKNDLDIYKWFADAKWVVEAHTAGGYRPHIHMLVHDKVKPNRLIDQISNKLKLNKQCIDAKSYNRGRLYHEHMKYLAGEKQDKKLENTQNDINERNENNIPHII